MILSPNWYSQTSVTGMVSFATAGISSGIAWCRGRRSADVARLAAWITIFEVFLFLDIVFDWRWKLHAHLMQFAIDHARYGQRRIVQTAALVLLAAFTITCVTAVARKLRSNTGAMIAASGAFLSLVCWLVEVISLHEVDIILYHKIGGFMMIASIWLVLGVMTAVGIQVSTVAHSRG
jgi:hypothetical protein